MTRGISKTLNMKSLEEILAETEEEFQAPIVSDEKKTETTSTDSLMSINQMKGTDHAEAMDDLYAETIDVARKIVDMGMNIDPARAPRMFEVANQLFKTAQDSKISKRDSELKTMKLIQEQKKIELAEIRLKHELGNTESIKGDVVMIEDRNTLLKIMREQKANPSETPD